MAACATTYGLTNITTPACNLSPQANPLGSSRMYLGDTYLQMQQYDKAQRELEAIEHVAPKEALIHLDLGIIAQETNHRAVALRELKETVALTPQNVNAHFRLARIYQQMGNRAQAQAEFELTKTLNKQRDESLHERIAQANAHPNPDVAAGKKQPPTAPQP